MKTTIDAAGRVVVPKPLRDRLSLAAGSEIEIELVGDGIVLRPASAESAIVAEDGVLVHRGGTPVALDVVAFLRGARASRIAPSAGDR